MTYSMVTNEKPATIGIKKTRKGISNVVSKVPLLFNVVIIEEAAIIPNITMVQPYERS